MAAGRDEQQEVHNQDDGEHCNDPLEQHAPDSGPGLTGW
jgi:hypothetical protein